MNNKTLKKLEQQKPAKKHRKVGRKRKRRKFNETPLGHFLFYEAPLEYGLIMQAWDGNITPPSADFIEAVSYASTNPLFRKPKFRRALMAYREFGLYCGSPRKQNVKISKYYKRLIKNQCGK